MWLSHVKFKFTQGKLMEEKQLRTHWRLWIMSVVMSKALKIENDKCFLCFPCNKVDSKLDVLVKRRIF